MEKLDHILRAEDEARHLVADARGRAQEKLRGAEAEAALIRMEAERMASEQARTHREALLAKAGKDAEAIEHDAAKARSMMKAAAEERVREAVKAVADELAR